MLIVLLYVFAFKYHDLSFYNSLRHDAVVVATADNAADNDDDNAADYAADNAADNDDDGADVVDYDDANCVVYYTYCNTINRLLTKHGQC